MTEKSFAPKLEKRFCTKKEKSFAPKLKRSHNPLVRHQSSFEETTCSQNFQKSFCIAASSATATLLTKTKPGIVRTTTAKSTKIEVGKTKKLKLVVGKTKKMKLVENQRQHLNLRKFMMDSLVGIQMKQVSRLNSAKKVFGNLLHFFLSLPGSELAVLRIRNFNRDYFHPKTVHRQREGDFLLFECRTCMQVGPGTLY